MHSDSSPVPYWRLSGFYLFYFATLGVLVPYWGLYLKSLGFSAAAIGELMAVIMATKLVAARICVGAGCATIIANGHTMHPLEKIEQGGPCTWFAPRGTPLAARKQWIAGSLVPRGVLVIDAGAEQALRSGRSLLPVGLTAVEGSFQRGDAVTVRNPDGREIARGLAAYACDEVQKLCGRRSEDIETLLGYQGRNEVVHRDNLVLLD